MQAWVQAGALSTAPLALQSSGPGASGGPGGDHSELAVRIASLEVENQNLRSGEALGLMVGSLPTPQSCHPTLSPCPHSGAGSAAGHLQAGGPAEHAGEELTHPPSHGPTDPSEHPSWSTPLAVVSSEV